MTPQSGASALLILALLIATACYIVACAAWPFKHCRRCGGTGKLASPTGRAVRLCPRCRHTGLRLRAGRRLWNHLRRLHNDSR